MKFIKIISISIILVIIIILFSSFFIIRQGQNAILLRLGKLVIDNKTKKAKILTPGLNIKIPFIEHVYIFDTRLQTLDIKSSRIVTKEKKDVIVGYYVKWKINNLPYYFKSTGGQELDAESLLAQQLNTALRAEFGKRIISELVSGCGREDINDTLRKKAEQKTSELGIKIIDVRIKGIELPDNTSNAIYQLMRANMKKIANKHRADGNAKAEVIRAEADAKISVLLATANSNGKIIRSLGKAKASSIYIKAYQKNPKFFVLYKSLKAYQDIFNNKDYIIIDQNNNFLKFFKNPINNK